MGESHGIYLVVGNTLLESSPFQVGVDHLLVKGDVVTAQRTSFEEGQEVNPHFLHGGGILPSFGGSGVPIDFQCFGMGCVDVLRADESVEDTLVPPFHPDSSDFDDLGYGRIEPGGFSVYERNGLYQEPSCVPYYTKSLAHGPPLARLPVGVGGLELAHSG